MSEEHTDVVEVAFHFTLMVVQYVREKCVFFECFFSSVAISCLLS